MLITNAISHTNSIIQIRQLKVQSFDQVFDLIPHGCAATTFCTYLQFEGLDADRQGATPVNLVVRRRFEEQCVGALRAVGVRLSRPGAGEGALDHDVQRDGRRPLG